MAVSPNPRTLLLPDPDVVPSVLSDKFIPIFAATLGVVSVMISKAVAKKPITSGIQQYLIAAGLGVVLGKVVDDRYDRYNMEKEAILRHYIELHPEDFPDPERKKIGEVFSTWTPIR